MGKLWTAIVALVLLILNCIMLHINMHHIAMLSNADLQFYEMQQDYIRLHDYIERVELQVIDLQAESYFMRGDK